jgi:hypothetical protein
MRLTKPLVTSSLLLVALSLSGLCARAQDSDTSPRPRRGTAPRSSAYKYRANAKQEGISIGADLLTSKEVSKEFAASVNQCCLAVEVALYPKPEQPLNISLDDFTLFIDGNDSPMRPQSATAVSAKLEKKSSSNGGVTTSGSVGIGYESGTTTDPVTGQPVHVHGVTTSAGAGVGVGGSGTPPTVAEHEREVIERELSDKGLPEVKIAIPVSGFLYFSLPKKKKGVKYRLEYVVNGETLNLQFP